MPDGHGGAAGPPEPAARARPPLVVLRRARTQAGLVAMVTALVVAGATVLGLCALLLTSARDQALVAAVRGTDPASVQVAAAVTLADGATAADAAARVVADVSATAHGAFAAFPTTESVWSTSTPWYLDPLPDGDLRQTYLLDGDDVTRHATLTSGRWPASGPAVAEVALPASTAALLGVAPGSTLTLTGAPQHSGEAPVEPLTVLVVGTFVPRLGDPAWARDPLGGAGYAPAGADFPTYGPLVVAPGTLLGHRPVAHAVVTLTPDLGGATTPTIAAAAAALGGLRAALDQRLGARVSGLALTDPFPQTVQQMRAQLGVTASGVLVAALLASALAGTALGLAARLLVERRAAEHALLTARGAAPRQLAAHAAAEAVALAAVATVLGVPLSVLAFRAVARVPRLARAGMDAVAGPTPALVATVAVAALVLSGVLVVVALRAGHERGRVSRRGLVARSGVDVLLVALAVLGYLQLRAHGVATGAAADPVLVAAPVLCLVAGAVVALRLLPWVTGLAEVHARRSTRLVVPLAAWEVSRRRHSTAGAFLLVLATAAASFGLTFVATWERSQADQADAQVGAQLAVDPGGLAPVAEGHALATATGGTPVAVTQRSVVLGTHIGGDAGSAATQLLATDLGEGRGLDVGRPPAGTTWAAATAGLASVRPAGPVLPAGGPLRLVVSGTVADGTPLVVTPSLVVQDRWGGQAVLDGSGVPLDGAPHRVDVAAGGASLPDGLRLVALDLRLALGDGAAPSRETDQTTLVTVRTAVLGATAGDGQGAATWSGTTTTDPWQVTRGSQATQQVDAGGVAVTATATVSVTGLLYEGGSVLVAAGPPVAEVPVVVTRALADELGAGPGTRVALMVGQSQVDARVTGVVPYLPAVASARAVLADRTTLGRALLGLDDVETVTDRWWVDGLADPQAAAAAVTAAGLGDPVTRDGVAAQLRDGPLRMGLLAATWILVAAAGLLALWGTAAHVVASIGARAVEVARLLGLGMSRAAVRATFLAQHGAVCLVAVGAGALVGAGAGRTVVPLLVVSAAGGRPVPSPVVVWPWPSLAVAVALLGVGSVVLAAPVAAGAVRRASAAHLRMDVEP